MVRWFVPASRTRLGWTMLAGRWQFNRNQSPLNSAFARPVRSAYEGLPLSQGG